MLINLYVKNFAIIEEVNIDFGSGLNILSGETGSGKSLLIKALNLLKGDRFSRDYLGNFADKTIVEAVFNSNENINKILIDNNFDIEDNIILTRQFTETSSITKINNRACSIKFLNYITNLLYDVHGQHSNLIILDKANYIKIIDDFDNETIGLKKNLSENLFNINKLYTKLKDLDLSEEEISREKDILEYQINEIEDFDFKSYDEEKLNKEYKKLSNQKELIDKTSILLDFLTENNRNHSFRELTHILYDQIKAIENIDEDFSDISSDAINIVELTNDLSKKVESYLYTLNIDEERLQIIEQLFATFQNLKVKYGRTIDEILEFLENIKNRYTLINNIDAQTKEMNYEINQLKLNNIEIAEKLNSKRKKIAKKLEEKIVNELEEMNMENVHFKIKFDKKESIQKDGFDDIDFMISTNKGQDLKSLSQVSSGGEISRFMLAMKSSLSENDDIQTVVYDEIDTGISGKTADIVGDKLKKISRNIQLIVISHLPQIAAKSDYHYILYKQEDANITRSFVKQLDKDGKIKEIARLISGSDITKNSLISAKELLEENND